jgi:hypothetical protein
MTKKRNQINKTLKQGDQFRVRIYEDEINMLNDYRRIYSESVENGLDPATVKHGWIKNKKSSLFFKNPMYKDGEELEKNKFAKDLIKQIKEYAPIYPKLKRKKLKDSNLLVIDPADVHIGKLCDSFETGEDYDSEIAVKRVLEGVHGILNKIQGYNIDKILFVGGNDILHVDTPKNTTTSGTSQDTCGMWYSNFLKAKKLYVNCLEILLQIADIHFVFNPSNHDYMSGFFLADVIKTHFRNNKNITFDCGMEHRKYYKYNSSLIATTHGDGAKMQDLPLLMATESSRYWADSKHRYVYTHHVHHKVSKDYIGVTVESLRSPSGTDSWHHRNGYQHAKKAIEGYIHSKDSGQIARITHLF